MKKTTPNRFLALPALALVFTGILAAGCTPTVAVRGNIVEDYRLAEVQPGVHTRSDVMRLLGSPTTEGTFDPNTWYYLGQKTEKRGILDPEVIEEKIVVVEFDDMGVVQTVNNVDPNRQNIPYVREKTQTSGNEMTALQQMMGNLGRFNSAGSQATGN